MPTCTQCGDDSCRANTCDCALGWCTVKRCNSAKHVSIAPSAANFGDYTRRLRPDLHSGRQRGEQPTGRQYYGWHHFHPLCFKWKRAEDYSKNAKRKTPMWVLKPDAVPCAAKHTPPPHGVFAEWKRDRWETPAAAHAPAIARRLQEGTAHRPAGESRSSERAQTRMEQYLNQLEHGTLPTSAQAELAAFLRSRDELRDGACARMEQELGELARDKEADRARIASLQAFIGMHRNI